MTTLLTALAAITLAYLLATAVNRWLRPEPARTRRYVNQVDEDVRCGQCELVSSFDALDAIWDLPVFERGTL